MAKSKKAVGVVWIKFSFSEKAAKIWSYLDLTFN